MIYPERDMNVLTKCYAYQSNCCQDSLPKPANVNLMVVLV